MLSNSKKLQRTELMRLDAMKTFLEIDMSNRLRTAMLRKSRPFRGGFEIGQRLAYWRVRNTLDGEGPFAGYCQGVLIGMDPGPRGSLWIRNDRGRLVQVAREQARALEAEEAWMPGNSDFRLLRDAEQDLSEKHAVGQDQRQAAIRGADQPPLLALPEARSPLDAQGQPTASVSAPPVIVQPPQLQQPLQPLPSSEPQRLDSSPQQPMEGILADGTKKSAPEEGVGSLASAGEVPKRVKTQHPSQPPSRMASSDATLVDPTSIAEGSVAAGSAHMVPVPEDSVGSGSSANRRFDQPGQSDEKMDSATAQAEQIFHVHAKAYCRLCGSVNKLVEAGVTRCGRCMNSTFTDDVDDVLNWFDEDEKFDGVCKRMTRNTFHVQEGLPGCDALRDVAASRQWLTSEVLVVDRLDQVPLERHTSEKDYPVMSYAAWYGADDMWLWEMVHNSPTEGGYSDVFFDEEKEVNPEHYVVFLQKSTPFKVDPVGTRAHGSIYRDRPCEMVWLQRHGRDLIRKVGWDGSPQEMQSLYTNGNLYLQAYLLGAYNSEDHPQCYAAWLTDETAENSSEDDEEDVPRTQRQAMKRELPWRTIPEADIPAFVTAIQSEWNEWCKWSSCKAVAGAKVPKELILPSRVCYRWKPTPNTGGYKAKARIVIQGFKDPHLPLLTRDAPVLSRNGLMTILQWSASYGTTLYNADAKSAFLQGLPDDERPAKIYMRPPKDKISLLGIPDWNLDILYELIAPVYGAANAPRRWYGRFRGVVESMKWKVHSLDPCLFLWVATWKDKDGQDASQVVALLGVHVDDIMVTALLDWEKEAVEVELGRKTILSSRVGRSQSFPTVATCWTSSTMSTRFQRRRARRRQCL